MTAARILSAILALFAAQSAWAQIDFDQTGAWYVYAWNASLEDSNLGFQGDIQHRNWDSGSDLQQILVRGGVSWAPEGSRNRYTFGVAHVTSAPIGPRDFKFRESRIYQEALLPRRVGTKIFMTHRFRFEQRWIDGQDFRTRARYFFGLNYPFNRETLGRGAIYLAFYNELFVNLERDIGNGLRVEHFDRNRVYLAGGYSVRDNLRLQLGYMHQETEILDKGQVVLSLNHAF